MIIFRPNSGNIANFKSNFHNLIFRMTINHFIYNIAFDFNVLGEAYNP